MDPDPYAIPLDEIDVSRREIFENNTFDKYFERLRKEDPVHFCATSEFGPYWSVTKYNDIMQVEKNHKVFSSEGGITIDDQDEDFELPMFIAMDPPKHDLQRMTVTPAVAPQNLVKLETTIRERVAKILDSLPLEKTFNWVDLVSIELTTQMLATLFDFPFEERSKLTRWSDVATADEESGVIESEEQRREELLECLAYFTELWNQRVNAEPGNDLISMLAHGESTRNMEPMEYLGNLILLIVGGNDTTRNSISGGVLALNEYPDQYQKLRDDHSLIPNMVSEIIRWQTPLAHMRRRALEDTELGGKLIKKGDKVVLWYVSGNRDEDVIDRASEFIIDRPRARRHLSFGFGIHRCMGNRLAEMQLRIVWEEILQRFHTVEVVGEPVRVRSSFVKGYSELPVRLHA
ncbi:MAG: cytochrome P450 [Gammaproteobacteria bacterium]|nr:cytochrome P450 [Gammaproteobacteria bacterium]